MALILKTVDPTIQQPIIKLNDLDSSSSKNRVKDGTSSGFSERIGEKAPFIRIGNAHIDAGLILSLHIEQSGIIPTVQISFIDESGAFTSTSFPKTNPLVTVYVASTHRKLKSFSQTFLITSTSSIPIGPTGIRYDLYGELYVPKLMSNFIKSYSKLSSSEVLKQIATELGLGFATNEELTNDTMTWINPNLSYLEFIKRITEHAYKSDSSFFDCFIDRYYVLNLINVERQFTGDLTPDNGYPANYQGYLDQDRVENPYSNSTDDTIPLVISNTSQNNIGSELNIQDFSLISETGNILKLDGFRKRLISYRHGDQDPIKSWFAEPISELPAPDGSIYQLPQLSDFTANEVVKWAGIDYSNTHANYKFAKLINHHNKLETEKTLLKVRLNGLNQNIIRGSRLAVVIVKDRLGAISTGELSDDYLGQISPINSASKVGSNSEIFDPYLSNFYYVKEISYHYDLNKKRRSAFYTELILSRKSWIPEPKLDTN